MFLPHLLVNNSFHSFSCKPGRVTSLRFTICAPPLGLFWQLSVRPDHQIKIPLDVIFGFPWKHDDICSRWARTDKRTALGTRSFFCPVEVAIAGEKCFFFLRGVEDKSGYFLFFCLSISVMPCWNAKTRAGFKGRESEAGLIKMPSQRAFVWQSGKHRFF